MLSFFAEKVKRKADLNLLLYVEPARCFPIGQKSKKESKLELAFVC